MGKQGSIKIKRGPSSLLRMKHIPKVVKGRTTTESAALKKEYNYVFCPRGVCIMCDGNGIVHATVAERYNKPSDIRIEDNHFISKAHKKLLLAGKQKVTPYGRKD